MQHRRTSDRLLALFEGEGGSGAGSGTGGAAGATGGSETSSGAGTGPPNGGTGTGAGEGGTGNGGGSGGSGEGKGSDKDTERRLDSQPQWVQQLVRELRDEAATNRTKKTAAENQNADLLAKIGAALGLTNEASKDPEKLTADLATAGERIKTLETELAVFRSADEAGGDPHALLDSRSFLDSVYALDTSASDYTTRLRDKIKQAVEANPRLGLSGSGSRNPFHAARSGIGQERPGSGQASTGVAAGRALRRERHPARTAPQQTTTTR